MSKRLTLKRELCFVEIIEGETDSLERQCGELGFVERLRELDVRTHSIEINGAGCFVVVDSDDIARLHIAARPFNLAVRLHERCGLISLRGDTRRPVLPVLRDVIARFHVERVRIVHVSAIGAELSVLVDDDDVAAATLIMESFAVPARAIAA